MKTKTKGQMGGITALAGLAVTLVVVGLVAVIGIELMDDTQTDIAEDNLAVDCGLNSTGVTGGTVLYTNCGAAYNGSGDAIEGIAKIPEKLPLIVTAVVGAILISIIITYLAVKA